MLGNFHVGSSRVHGTITSLLTPKHTAYAEDGSTILSSLVFWGAHPIFWLADPDAIKTVTSDRHTYRKEIEPVSFITFHVYEVHLKLFSVCIA